MTLAILCWICVLMQAAAGRPAIRFVKEATPAGQPFRKKRRERSGMSGELMTSWGNRRLCILPAHDFQGAGGTGWMFRAADTDDSPMHQFSFLRLLLRKCTAGIKTDVLGNKTCLAGLETKSYTLLHSLCKGESGRSLA